jgi:hypothetical protein
LSPKDKQKEKAISLRITEELDSRLEMTAKLYKEKTGIKTTKTMVIESAIEEGLNVIETKLKNEK